MHLSIFSAAILCIAGSSVDATPVKRGMRRIARPIHFTHLGPSAPPQPGVATNSTTKVFNMRGCRRSQRRIAEQLGRSRLLPLGGKQAVVAQASTGVEVLTDDYSNGTDNGSSCFSKPSIGSPSDFLSLETTDYYGNLLGDWDLTLVSAADANLLQWGHLLNRLPSTSTPAQVISCYHCESPAWSYCAEHH